MLKLYYIEVSNIIFPNIINNIFNKIHNLHYNNKNLGFDFPEYTINNFGNKIRYISDSYDLLNSVIEELNKILSNSLCEISSILEVPNDIKEYAIYKRIRPQKSNTRTQREFIKKYKMLDEDILKDIEMRDRIQLMLPYIKYHSKSNNKMFSIFLKKKISKNNTSFMFNSFGLNGSVPKF